MAADLSASERAYQEIKRQVLGGRFHLRQRLDANALAEDLGLSTTPVREALVRLDAERLIGYRPTRGFFITLWSTSELADLYAWRGELAEIARARKGAQEIDLPRHGEQLDYPLRAPWVLQALVSANALELLRASQNADERLHFARVAESALWADVAREWEKLEAKLVSPSKSAKRALQGYYLKRIEAAGRIRERAIIQLSPNGG